MPQPLSEGKRPACLSSMGSQTMLKQEDQELEQSAASASESLGKPPSTLNLKPWVGGFHPEQGRPILLGQERKDNLGFVLFFRKAAARITSSHLRQFSTDPK